MSKNTSSRYAYGGLPDVPDHRDHLYAAPVVHLAKLPVKADLRARCSPVYDQGELGSGTANAIDAAIQFERRKQKLKLDFVPSRLFICYNERAMEHTLASDADAQIRDGIKSVGRQGDRPETEWRYNAAKFTSKPPTSCYKDRPPCNTRVPHVLNQMKGGLASNYPFVFGFSVYTEFEGDTVAQTGALNMPGPKEKLHHPLLPGAIAKSARAVQSVLG